jgi:D-glycero-alpha-D-manno-heptose-7-phosphate kinase
VRIESSAPTRIDLAGGTYDIWPLYLFHPRAQTINAAISLRARCTLTSRGDDRVVLISEDTGERVEAAGPESLDLARLPLVARRRRHGGARGGGGRPQAGEHAGAGQARSGRSRIRPSARASRAPRP